LVQDAEKKEVLSMAREQGILLDSGDVFPNIEFQTVEGKGVRLPADVAGKWTALIFYRGDW